MIAVERDQMQYLFADAKMICKLNSCYSSLWTIHQLLDVAIMQDEH